VSVGRDHLENLGKDGRIIIEYVCRFVKESGISA
jgi:hypothetical protein